MTMTLVTVEVVVVVECVVQCVALNSAIVYILLYYTRLCDDAEYVICNACMHESMYCMQSAPHLLKFCLHWCSNAVIN